ncbi:MAG TPA: 2'-5' RNA ligase family protein [Allosphingosinicella sp.]|jgi:2'-5' RNA ligase
MAVDHRYFFCLRPSPLLAKRIGAFRSSLGYRGSIVSDHRLHVTLGITGDYPLPFPKVADCMMAIGGQIDAEPFSLFLDRLSGSDEVIALRPSRRPPQLGILQRQIERWMRRSGVLREGWKFAPHSTLLYRKGDPFLLPCEPFEWAATELVLIHSLVGATRHVELGRWPLVRRQLELAL